MKIAMYAHGGSKNHGCEAIIRSTTNLLKDVDENPILLSYQQKEDMEYGLDKVVEIRQGLQKINKKSFDFLKAYFQQKITKKYHQMDALQYKDAILNLSEVDLALFVGGDNYCYSDVKNYKYINDFMRKRAKKMVLWGTSVEPDLLQDSEIRRDIGRFDCIIARETISYEALKKVNHNTRLLPDPAFFLSCESVTLPMNFEVKNTIGINVSPLVIGLENGKGILLKNYEKLIQFILENTEYKIALIPHVIWEGNDDREPLKYLYQKFAQSGRMILVEDHNCMQQKYIISQCKYFIGARTHATIAAYSTGVPTIVVGYSVKARGIAKDLFGTEEGYVISAQGMESEDELVHAFTFLEKNEATIREELHTKMEEYTKLKDVYKELV